MADDVLREIEALQRELDQVKRQLLLETAQRREAESRAHRIDQETAELISLISHDLGTPLVPIIGFVDFYQIKHQGGSDQELSDLLALIREQADRALTMLRKLSAYGKTRCLERPGEPVDVDSVLDEVVAELQFDLAGRGLELVRNELAVLPIPEEHLRRIFSILLDNAVRHAGSHAAPVEIGTRECPGTVQLFVRDHGVGIAEDIAGDIFSIFPRGSGPDQGKGTGTGLATLKKIANFYGGRTWFESTAGGGATFWVEFTVPDPK